MPEEIKQLKAWFQAYELRFNEIRLSNYEYIFDLRKFIEVQVNSVKGIGVTLHLNLIFVACIGSKGIRGK